MAPRTWVIAAGIVLAAVVLLALTRNSLEDNDAYSSIAAALVAIGTAFAGIVLYLSREQRPPAAPDEADALALEVLGQWEPEIRHRRRRFGDQRLIPLGWTGTGIGPVRLRLDGRLDGNPDAAATNLADAFDQLPSRRLVVIGEPGSGKTFLGVMLTVGLLRRRAAGDAVPVFLSLSSWDPVADSLDDWLVRTLATTYYNGRRQVVRALLLRRLLLPVLDGLDELPDHARRRAVNRLNDVLDGDRPLVLTCRITEYEDLIAGGAPTLLRAPVVRINPVTTADVVTHLRAWPDFASHVEREPDSPVATALGTPLMLSLFAAAYENRSPAELTRFTSRHAVEDHLVDLMVDTIYPDPSQRRWLTYLAEVLHRNDDHDFRWWQLAGRTLSPWIAPVLGLLVAAVAYALVTWLRPGSDGDSWADDPAGHISSNASLIATLFGIVVTSLWLAGSGREPAPVSAGPRGFGRGILTGAALVLIPGAPIVLFGTDAFTHDLDSRSTLMTYAGALVALAVVAGIGVGLHELLATRASSVGKASPEAFLRHDRGSALTSAAVTGLVVGALAVVTSTLGAALGGHLGQRLASTEFFPAIVNLTLPPLQTHVPWEVNSENTAALVTTTVLFVVLFAVAVLATRAWTRFLVARAVLALAGRLPWRLMRFLADARERGLLRVAGGGYQFWHVRLQERLVMKAGHRGTPRRLPRAAVAGVAVTALVAAVVAVWSAEPEDCPATGWSEVDQRMARVTYRSATGCFAYLSRNDWHHLEKLHGDEQLLDRIAQRPPSRNPPFGNQLTVVGDLVNPDPVRWQETLRGLAAAMEAGERPLTVEFVHSDTGHRSSRDLDVVHRHYLRSTVNPLPWGAAITLEGTRSTVFRDEPDSPWAIIGMNGTDLSSVATAFKDKLIGAQVSRYGPLVPAAHLADGISDEECVELSRVPEGSAPVNVDLRGFPPATNLLARIATCAQVSAQVLVDQQYAGHVEVPTGDRMPWINVDYLDDRSATITSACRAKVTTSIAMDGCVAALAAADHGRVALRSATSRA